MNNAQKFQIRNLENHTNESVALIHAQAFPDSLLTLFGQKTIQKYYYWQMVPPNVCHAMGVFDQDALLGFCFAGSFRNSEIYFIQDHFFYFFWHLITHPRLWFDKRIFTRFISTFANLIAHLTKGNWKRNKTEQVKKDRFGILSIAVAPRAQGLGIGKMLMDEVESIAMRNHQQKIELKVHPDNHPAVAFYEKLGWEKVYYDPHTPWQGYMTKTLS